MDQEKIGLFIAKMRKKKKLTQQELANKLGVTDKAISNWENGRRMPDVSLYKDLCKELDISLNELINGEIEPKEMTRDSIDNTIIKTLNYNEENRKKFNKIIKILVLILGILVIFIGKSYHEYSKRYPKIDIYKISVVDNQENKLVDQLIANNDNIIWYYSLGSVRLCDAKDNCYDLLNAIVNKQTNMKKVREFLDKQVENKYIKKFNIYDGSITTYKSNMYDDSTTINNNQYEVIFCNDRKEVYFGKIHMENELQGKYCGIIEDSAKEFTRTYNIKSVTQDDSEEYKNVAISQFQSKNLVSVKVPSKFNLEVGKNYEFTFTTYETFDDTIENIFKYTTIKDVKETDKIGMEQIQQPINGKNK